MWFKNLVLYRFEADRNMTAESLHASLQPFAHRACGRMDFYTYGWDKPLGRHGSLLAHEAGGCILLSARKEERLLPPAVVREVLGERVEAIEAEQGRPVRRREKDMLRDEIVQDLLPRAFTRSNYTGAFLAPRQGWLVVDGTAKKAEELVALLAQGLPGLDIAPLDAPRVPAAVMTRWLDEQPPRGFAIRDECELTDPAKEGALVRCRRVDLDGEEIAAHLRAGRQVSQLALAFEDRLTFVLGADLTVKRLRFEAVEESDSKDLDDPLARFDADFAFMTSEVLHFLPALEAAFADAAD